MFTDETGTRLTGTANPAGADDNAALWLDADNDGDADLLIGTLGTDRLLLNDGTGHFTLSPNATPNDTDATLGIAVADSRRRWSARPRAGPGRGGFPRQAPARDARWSPIDTSPPVVTVEKQSGRAGGVIHARVHDHQSPSRAHDWQRVWIEHNGPIAVAFESGPPPPRLRRHDVVRRVPVGLAADRRRDQLSRLRDDCRNNQGCSSGSTRSRATTTWLPAATKPVPAHTPAMVVAARPGSPRRAPPSRWASSSSRCGVVDVAAEPVHHL